MCIIASALAYPPILPPPCSTGLEDVCVDDCDCVWCPEHGCFSAPRHKKDLPRALENVCGSRTATHKTHAFSPHCERWHALGDVMMVAFLGYFAVVAVAAPLICIIGCWCHFRGQRRSGFRPVAPHEQL